MLTKKVLQKQNSAYAYEESFAKAKLGGGNTMTILKSHCCFCSMQCGIDLIPDQSEPTTYTVKASADFPVATGRLCQKGFNVMEHTLHPSRITEPLKRMPSGELV